MQPKDTAIIAAGRKHLSRAKRSTALLLLWLALLQWLPLGLIRLGALPLSGLLPFIVKELENQSARADLFPSCGVALCLA